MDETLQDKITRLSNELDALEQKGITTEEDINLRNQLINEKSQAEYDLAQQEKIEEKIEAEAIPFAVAGVDLDGIPVEVIRFGEVLVKADRRRIHTEHAIEKEQDAKQHAQEMAALQVQIIDLQDKIKTQAAIIEVGTAENKAQIHDIGNLRDHIAELNRDNEDLSTRVANAARLIDELKQENSRLQSEVDDYRLAKVHGEREAQGILDVTPDESNDINAALENVKKLYKSVEDWGSVLKVNKPDGTYELAKRAEVEADWAPIEAPAFEGGSEPQGNFLGKDQTPADNGDPQAVAEAPEVVEDAPFQEATPLSGTDHDTVDGEMVDETFEEEVRRRLSALELEVFHTFEDEAEVA